MDFILEQVKIGVFRKCPSCNVIFDKDNGCNWVKCILCNTEFCWFCGLKKGEGCPYNNTVHNSH